MKNDRLPSFSKGTIVIVGGYGSGKSEVAVNLSRAVTSATDRPVTIADLDIVNPYFRSREATLELERMGIRCLVPKGALASADLPVIIPEIRGAIEEHDGTLILDVGGDDVGSRVLASIYDAFAPDSYEMLFVVNANRPFTSTVEGAQRIMEEISVASRLSFTGLIANTHMLTDTTAETVREGLTLTKELSVATGLPIVFVSAIHHIMEELADTLDDYALLPLDRTLLKPWERRS